MAETSPGPSPSHEELLATVNTLASTLATKILEVDSLHARLTELVGTADTKLSEISAVATTALAAKTQIADEQAVIATKSTHIQDAQEHADKVRAELDRIQTSATQQATEAEGQRQRAQTATDAATEILAAIRAQRTAAEADAVAAAASRDEAKTSASTSKKLADKAESVEAKIAAYEAMLAELETQSNAQLATITGLLPGATAAGLAHAFDDRRKSFLKPSTRWQWLFVGSVLSIVLLALTGLWQVYGSGSALSWDELARLWLARIPIAGALVWLALHASRESALAKRLEEDYGYKAAIAASFLGFQKQMADIGSSAGAGSPLGKLCADTLATIASPPGRIYERHKLTVTPASELAAAATRAAQTQKPAT